MDSDPDFDARLDALVAEALEALERGGPAAVEELRRRHPADAAELGRRLQILGAAGLMSSPGAAEEPFPETLGEFRLRRRLGGGGMGVVYLAEQPALQRWVALKLVRPEHLFFPAARERFRREAEAVARLSHPGIVPVYTVGEESGVPFLAMELVRGATLAEVIEHVAGRDPATLSGEDLRAAVSALAARRLSESGNGSGPVARASASDAAARLYAGSWPNTVLRIVRAVAEALQHSHERGVLHRDLKPSNILLTPDGRVLLFDFGLAATEGNARITRSGLRLGSLAYMSPEQLDGPLEALDARSDVYALGVTLYEALTLRLPFAPGGGEALASAIREGRPRAPREANPSLSRDAETVCLAAMDRDPARRYASAAALAQDLVNVLELRPVAARRPGPLLRARRWTQRHPAAATALLLGGVLVVGGPLLYAREQQRTAARVQVALDRAEADLTRALDAVNAMLVRVGDAAFEGVPLAEAVRRDVLEDAADFVDRFLADNPDDPRVLALGAHAANRLGYASWLLGDLAAARGAYERAAPLAEAALARRPDELQALQAAAEAWEGAQDTRFFSGDLAGSHAALERADALRRTIAERSPGEAHGTIGRASVLERRARLQLHEGARAEALETLVEAAALGGQAVKEAVGAGPQAVTTEFAAATIHGRVLNNLADHQRALGRAAEAEAHQQQAVAVYARLVELKPSDLGARMTYAGACTNLGNMLSRRGAQQEGLELLFRSADSLRETSALYPASAPVRLHLAVALSSLYVPLDKAGRRAEAEAPLLEAIALYEQLGASSDAQALGNHAASLVNLGALLNALGRADETLEVELRAREKARLARTANPAEPQWRVVVQQSYVQRSRALLALGRPLEAAAEGEALLGELNETAEDLVVAAGLIAAAAKAVRAQPAEDEAAREGAAAPLDERALSLLEQAVERGWTKAGDIDTRGDFAEIRTQPRARALVERARPAAP